MTDSKPIALSTLTFSKDLRLLVLGPHPDDFDVIGVTLRYFWEQGNPLFVGVSTSGSSGVEDSFCSPSTWEMKAFLREQEQISSCQYFGLPDENLTFLRLEEDASGHPIESRANIERIHEHFQEIKPNVVFLPYGNDTNTGHQRIFTMFQQVAKDAGYPLVAFLNRDPKTIQMRHDLYMGYDEVAADWKRTLLQFHKSQQQRNLNQRGFGFDDRIQAMDSESAALCSLELPFAEVFELSFYGGSKLDDLLK